MKLSELPTNTNLSTDDLIYCVDAPSGTPQSRKATIAAVLGLSYAGTNTWTGLQTFTAATAGTQGVIVRGASGQTANLQEWQSSSGTVLARFNNTGTLSLGGNQSANTAVLTLVGETGRTSPIVFDAANILSFGKGTNGNYSMVFMTGTSTSPLTLHHTSYGALVTPPTTSAQGVIVRGVASQSANLQEWQTSSGNVVAYIDALGRRFSLGETGTPNVIYLDAADKGINVASYVESRQITFSQLATTSGGDVGISRSAAGVLRVSNGSSGNGALICGSPTVSTVSLTVRAIASQTANLQEWQNSSGTVLANVTPSGGAIFASALCAKGAQGDTSRGFQLLRGSDSANLLNIYQNSSNETVMTSGAGPLNLTSGIFRFAGPISAASIGSNNGTMAFGNGGSLPGATLTINGSTYPGFVVKGAASQSANLQEWQNSLGTALATVTKDGDVELTDSTRGIILKSPDGTRYRVTVANGGTLTTTAI